MVHYKKLLIWFILGVVFLTTLLVGFGLLLPYLINLEPFKEKISKTISQQANVKISYQRVDLSYFPRPCLKIYQVHFFIPEKADGIMKAVEVYPEWLPLFKGKFRVRKIHVESPNVNFRLPKEQDKTKEKLEPNLLKKTQEMLVQTLMILPKTEVIIKNGRGSLSVEPKLLLSMNDLDAILALTSETGRIEVTCSANHWENLKFDAVIEPRSFKGSGRLEVKKFHPHVLLNTLFPSSSLNFKDAWPDLKISFKTDGVSDLQAKVEASLSSLTLRAADNDTIIKGDRLKGAFWMKGRKMGADLKEWNLKNPYLKLSGRFHRDSAIPSIQVEIEGRNVEVLSTRKVFLALTAKRPNIQTILGYMQGGILPTISLSLSGSSLRDLAKTENMLLRGRMTDGQILVPIPHLIEPLRFTQVKGEVVISKGILQAKNIEAKWEHTYMQGGELRVGFTEKDPPFYGEASLDTDLSQLPPLLRPFFKKKDALQEIDQINQLKGRARLKFVLSETLSALKIKASVQDIRLIAHYGRIPFPLSINGGDASYEGEKISFRNLKGTVGRSSFSRLTAELNLKKEPYMEVRSGEWAIMLDELPSWRPFREASKKFLKETTPIKGIVRLSHMRMQGPLNKPKNWHFEIAGDWQGISLDTHIGPASITSSTGKFRADPERITFSDVEGQVMNASVRVSGTVSNYLDELDRVELDLEGKVTPQEIQWLRKALKVKREIPVLSPLTLSKTHLSWRKKGGVLFRGDVMVEKGPKIYLGFIQMSGHLKVDPLTLRDEASNCSAVLDLKEGLLKVGFSGELSERTLDKIFSGYQFQNGRIKGDFQATLVIDRPIRSTVQGRFEADAFSFPWQFQKPLEIEHISLRGNGKNISVEEARFSWGEMPLALSGTGSFSEKGLLMDIDLSTEQVDLHRIAETLQIAKNGKSIQNLMKFQAEGTIRFKTNSFRYDRFVWKPLWAKITIVPNSVEARIEEANLCGMSTPGVLKVTGLEWSFDIRPFFKGREFEQTARCLLGQEVRITGNLDLKGRVFARGQPQDLLHSLKGDMELGAKDGQIYYVVVLSRILEFLNITEIYRGQLPDLKREGLPYKLILLKGSFDQGRFVIKEFTLDGKTLEIVGKGELDLINQQINLTVLVAPLKTVDRIIKFIPLVREILAGTLISIPLKVHGSLKDPQVTYLSPSAIANELVEMMKRTLRLPFKLFEPLFPPKKENENTQ